MVGQQRVVAAVAGLSVVLVASLLLLGTQSLPKATVLATQSEIDEITFAERQDMKPSSLEAKNDDGHTKIWDAAVDRPDKDTESKTVRAAVKADDHHGPAYYGMPRFHAHATGWVQDFAAPRDRFGLPVNGPHAALQQSQGTTQLLQTTAGTKLSAQEKAKALQQVKDWETRELRTSFPDPNAAEAKAAASNVWNDAKQGKLAVAKAPTQELWNAGHNDEITLQNVGHLHPSEMDELRKMSPEYKQRMTKGAHITTATDMHFEPLRWLHEEGEPGAVKSRQPNAGAKLQSQARFQQLWNAAENDDLHAGERFSPYSSDKTGYHPSQWLKDQHDPTEMGAEHQPSKKLFRTDADHERNYEGSYVDDNSVGIKIDNLKGKATMLAQVPVKAPKIKLEEYAADDENAEIKKKLDELRDLAMAAVGNMPDSSGPVVQGIAKGDYDAVMAYLDEVAENLTGVPHGDHAADADAGADAAAEGDAGADAAAKGPAMMLGAVGAVPTGELVMALDAAMRPELEALPAQVKAAGSTEEKEQLVLHALSGARDNVALVLSDPLAAQKAARFQQAYEVRVLQQMRMMQARQLAVQQLMAHQAKAQARPALRLG